MTDGIPANICDQCRRDTDGIVPTHKSSAAGCGHTTTSASPQTCYCDFCAHQRGVCTICGSSMSYDSSPADRDEGITYVPDEPDKPHNGSRSVVGIIILSAVVMLSIAVVLALQQC